MGNTFAIASATTIRRMPLLLLLLLLPNSAAACDRIEAGETFWIRLLDPIASYSAKPGTPVRAMLVQSPECAGSPVFPVGSEVDGTVKSVRRVGMGLVHEVARIAVDFDSIVPPGEQPLPLHATMLEVSHGRESVNNGVIRGIRATDSPQGRITSRLAHLPTWNPYTDWFLLGYRLAFPIAPEPEIYLPPGADLRLQLTEALPVADRPTPPALLETVDAWERVRLNAMFQSAPERTTTRKGQTADVVNLAFMGTREQLDAAFRAAGWRQSDPTSTRSVLRQFHAFLSFQNYPGAPISRQLLEGQPSDMNWEKGLNSYAKRDHVRIWQDRESDPASPVWYSAFVRETGASLSWRDRRFIHHVDPDLDEGRDLVIRDLALAGCVAAATDVSRPEFPNQLTNATRDPMRTDGSLAVVRLKDCTDGLFDYSTSRPQAQSHPRSKFARYLRTELLMYRSDVVRGNIVYGVFDLTRMSIQALRHRRQREALLAGAPKRDARPTGGIVEGVDTGSPAPLWGQVVPGDGESQPTGTE